MSSIAIVNQKGGCGKSTAAGHLIRWLHSKGYSVALVDADAQQSSSMWINAIASNESEKFTPTVEVWGTSDEILEGLPEVVSQHDFTIIDGPAGISELTRAILLRAELALVPVQPTGFDIRSAADAVRLIKQAQSVRGGMPKAALFLSRAVKGTKLKEEAGEVLEEFGLPVLSTIIHQRQVVADTYTQELTVFEMKGRPATDSAHEFNALFEEAIAL